MDLGLKGRVALVAASSQGLGLAVAQELAVEGAAVVMCSRNDDVLQAACDSVREESGANVVGISADLSKAGEIERLVNSASDAVGPIDILVTNSGGPPTGTFEHLTPADWDDAIAGLLTSVVTLTRFVIPGMKERRWGRILNITSIAAKQPVENLMLSNSIRAGITGFAKTLAAEVAPFGVTVNNILPGYTATERVEELARTLADRESVAPADIRARWEAEIPMRRLARPDEFAAMAAFLVSERASYITGSSIAVDGGWIRGLL